MSKPKKNIDLNLLKRVLRLARPYRRVFILAALLTIVLAPLGILQPYIIKHAVDEYIFKSNIDGLERIILILFGLLILEGILRYVFTYSTSWLGQSVVRDLRTKVFNHITRLKLNYFDTTPIGTSTTRTINDIQSINSVFSQGVITIISDILTLGGVLFILFYMSWKLTLVCLITFPILIWATVIFKNKVRAAYQIVRNQISVKNAFLQEHISGMRIVQIFNAQGRERAKFKSINREYTGANLNSILYYAIFFPVIEILNAASLGLMVWYGARGVIGDEISLGTLIVFPLYVSMLFRPVRMLADKFNTLQMALVAAERVFGVLDLDSKIENKGSQKPEKLNGTIEFKNVSFSYTPGTPVIKELNLKINAGETLAIVGTTGSGKTTLLNLLNRFYEIEQGEILIDGTPTNEIDLAALRKRIAIVLQDVFLFSGSIYENISMRDTSISNEEILAASKMIGAHEILNKLPNGYDYEVLERGAGLSMGQRQLISFIRALVFNPNILILDEATSSVDQETEAAIQHAIETLIEKRTSIIIAHRLSTIRHADKILVMHEGRAAEYGTHEELMQIKDGHYRYLYEMQFLQEAV